jgi:hypothetical protein
MFNFFPPATLSGFKPKLKTPQKEVFWSRSLADCVLKAHGKATKSGKKENIFFYNFNEFTIFKVM